MPAITGGFEVALACDFLVASERARFGDTHSRVGVMPGWGLTVLLPQAIGVRRAREMSFTGNFLTADEAFQWGLVNHVVEHDDLLPFTRRLALDIIGNDQRGVRQIRSTYDAVAVTTVDDGWAIERRDAKAWVEPRASTRPRWSAGAGDHGARPLAVVMMVRHGRRCARPSLTLADWSWRFPRRDDGSAWPSLRSAEPHCGSPLALPSP